MEEVDQLAQRRDSETLPVLADVAATAHISSFKQYQEMYEQSINDPDAFWSTMAKETLTWFQPFTKVRSGGFEHGDIAWFLDGRLNACYQCVDRHAAKTPDKVAILWEGDEPTDVRRITYAELLREVSRFANVLRAHGVRKGDTVAIYLPMVPEAAFAMLACARIGAMHSVVFAGFSAEALRERILDAKSSVVITADQGLRGGRTIALKHTVDEALLGCPDVKAVLVYKHTSHEIPFHAPRDFWLHEEMEKQRPYCPCEPMDSEDPLFLLYTSGSTGRPKGVMHTTAGYILYAALTTKYIFDIHPDTIYASVADVGWITGHTYIVYGPLALGTTTFMFESVPTYPTPSRYWDMIDRHKINVLYTAPTAVRALMKFGDDPVKPYSLESLRVIGSVGEPINPAAWKWLFEVVGRKRCPIVDTYWQTETGGVVFTPLPGATPLKPGSTTFPFFGVRPVLLDDSTKQELKENDVKGLLVIETSWPSISRTIYGDHKRYLETYMRPFAGYYFTGDGVYRDKQGYYWIIGRVDDVINVSGHRLGTAEIESALVAHPACAEAAVIGVPHDVKGQGIFCYCALREGFQDTENTIMELKMEVRKHIGPLATPDHLVIVAGLPKTRSGKIMRRILRKIATGYVDSASLGDISTLADPSVVESIVNDVSTKVKGWKKADPVSE
eukprot:TRINITY_DN2075_c0_g1_i1.p1 TRINITY_DN2075_c0_g1~~TRINITY_DN2075_c0_g1_i1.p1  ORF type:complete len:672 (-),score=108.67 TRINITY_DN2075_c0_g1_i1:92-2107(-)